MSNDKSYFLYSRQYPNTLSILEGEQLVMSDFCKNAVFVFDTNSLLVPYNVGSESLKEIKRIFQNVLTPDRTFVAAHTLREFAKNRSLKISELYTELDKALSSLPTIKDFNYPILSEMESYQSLIDCKNKIAATVKDYKKSLQSLQKGINEWNWFDPVTKLYKDIFSKDNIIDVSLDETSLAKEFNDRMEDDIPPGNKDKSKPDNAIGDFLIWKSILELGKIKQVNVVFVTNDEKNDWMLKGNKKSISTRFELIDEFRRYSNKNFTCLNFADFLKIQGATEAVVTEVETVAEFNDITDDFDVFTCLNRITTIIKRFLANDDVREDSFIEDQAIEFFIREFLDKWDSAIDKDPNWKRVKVEFYGIEDTLSKINSLNFEIHYQFLRQKRSTYDQQIELKKQCKNYLALVKGLYEIEKLL